MMLQEITSGDVEIRHSFSDLSVSSRPGDSGFWEKPFKRPFWFPVNLSELRNSSSETVLIEGVYKGEKQFLLTKISEMMDKIIYKEALFKGIDTNKLLKTISEMLDDISFEWTEFRDEELFERIKRILALEAMSGILKEMSPEKIEVFDEAVKRRPVFK